MRAEEESGQMYVDLGWVIMNVWSTPAAHKQSAGRTWLPGPLETTLDFSDAVSDSPRLH